MSPKPLLHHQQGLSSPFNPSLANTFFRAGEIEAWNRGIQRILGACWEAESPESVLRYQPGDVWIEFPFSPEYVAAVRPGGRTTQEVTPEVTTEVTMEVNLLAALRGEMSRRELRDALGLRNDEHFRKAHLLPALKAVPRQWRGPAGAGASSNRRKSLTGSG